MVYVFDSNSLMVMSNYYLGCFPTLWQEIDKYVTDGKILSVREVLKEVSNGSNPPAFDDWLSVNKDIFHIPTAEEGLFVQKIFSTRNFRDAVRKFQFLNGRPVADPFVIAAAKVRKGCVVTQETQAPNSAKVPNICSHFGIECVNLETFLSREGLIY